MEISNNEEHEIRQNTCDYHHIESLNDDKNSCIIHVDCDGKIAIAALKLNTQACFYNFKTVFYLFLQF